MKFGMLVIGLGGGGRDAGSIDQLVPFFFFGHANGELITANANVTCMLKRKPPFTLDALHVLGQNPACIQPNINFTQYPTCSETYKIP